MNKLSLIKISKNVHVLALLFFFLPFFHNSCNVTSAQGKLKQEKEAAEAAKMGIDTGTQRLELDTVPKLNEVKEETIPSAQDGSLSERIAKKIPALKLLILPSEDNCSGIGVVIDSVEFYQLMGTFIAFLLLIIGLLLKFIEPESLKAYLLLELIAIIALAVAKPGFFSFETLWGYWACIITMGLLTLYDSYQVIIARKQNKGG